MTTEVVTSTPQSLEKAPDKPLAVTKSVKTFLYENMKTVEEALPRVGLTSEAVIRTALSQIYRNPVLGTCDRISLMRAIIEAASLGLSFALGRGYLVPFRNKVRDKTTGREEWRMEATFMPGYQGLVDLVRRSAQVKTVLAGAVYQGDEFEYGFGLTDDKFKHVPQVEPDDALLTYAYCLIRFLDGGYQLIVLTKKQIEAVRARSKSGENGPWRTDYSAMAIKTAVKRCTKLCPASIELSKALELDDAAETGQRVPLEADLDFRMAEQPQIEGAVEAPPPPPTPTATQRVSQKAADTLARARSTPVADAEEHEVEFTDLPPDTPPAAPVGPGRPPKCPGKDCRNNLRSSLEREMKLCDSCRQKQTDALRQEHGTAVVEEVDDDQPEPDAEPEPEEPKADPIEALSKKARYHFMVQTKGNLPEAELLISGLTNGKVQKFEKLAPYLREHAEFIEVLTAEIAS